MSNEALTQKTAKTAHAAHAAHAAQQPFNESAKAMLSSDAASLLKTVSTRMVQLNVSSLWIGDADLLRRARVTIKDIDAARAELHRAGAFNITLGLAQNNYELIDDDDDDTENAEAGR